jgi:predicted anti-sigma-YlaC factor YlaD
MIESAFSDHACGRSRELISLQLDGELSELGRTRLAAHLAACPSCRDFASAAEVSTLALRTSPLEQPSRQILVPHGRRTRLRAVQAGGIAAMLLVATAVATFAAPRSHTRRPNVEFTIQHVTGSEQQDQRIVRNLRLQQIKPVPVGLAGGVQ